LKMHGTTTNHKFERGVLERDREASITGRPWRTRGCRTIKKSIGNCSHMQESVRNKFRMEETKERQHNSSD
jgi:hypothetical protein